MPGKHSPEKLELRRRRAAERGFLKNRDVVPNINVTATACWADAVDEDVDCGTVDQQILPDHLASDPLSRCDPWARAAFPLDSKLSCTSIKLWASYKRRVPPPSCPLRASAPVFLPTNSPPSGPFPTVMRAGHFDADSAHADGPLLNLIDEQKQTIEVLQSQVADLLVKLAQRTVSCTAVDSPPSRGDYSSLEQRISELEANIKTLGQSMGSAIEASLSSRLPSLLGNLLPKHLPDTIDANCERTHLLRQLDSEKHFATLLRPHVEDIINITSTDLQKRLLSASQLMVEHTAGVIKGYDAIIQKSLGELSSRMDAVLPPPAFGTQPSSKSVATPDVDPSRVDCQWIDMKGTSAIEECATAGTQAALNRCIAPSPDIETGMMANIDGLVKNPTLNGKLAVVVGFDDLSGRHLVRLACRSDTIKIKSENLRYPASCQYCGSEVSTSQCYACDRSPNEGPPVSGNSEASASHVNTHSTSPALSSGGD